MKLILVIFVLSFCLYSSENHNDVHEEHEKHNESHEMQNRQVGDDSAVVNFSESKGFQLSHEAFDSLRINTIEVKKAKIINIDLTSLVTSLGAVGIYRLRNKHFKFIKLTQLKINQGKAIIESKDLMEGDKIVTHGQNLLKVADIFINDNSNYGHSH